MNCEAEHHDDRDDDDEQALVGDLDAAERVGLGADHLREEARRRAEDDLAAVLEQQRDADGRDERRQPRVVADGPVREPLDQRCR